MKKKLRVIKIWGITIFNLICFFSIIYCIVMAVETKQAVSEEADVRVIDEFEAPKTKTVPKVQLGEKVVVDDFEKGGNTNRFGSRANIYIRPPSRVMVAKRNQVISGKDTKVLMIKYDRKNVGGPYGMGGWCGYYTLVKSQKTRQYFDGSDYNYITFWVRGEKGDENFMVGLADEHWDRVGDSLKSEEIGVYLEKGKITTEWQKAKVPLTVFFLDYATLSAISINFEADCFPDGAGSGVVFIDDIILEK